jgi:predicted nucleic acid-binding Zn ribbon protein
MAAILRCNDVMAGEFRGWQFFVTWLILVLLVLWVWYSLIKLVFMVG